MSDKYLSKEYNSLENISLKNISSTSTSCVIIQLMSVPLWHIHQCLQFDQSAVSSPLTPDATVTRMCLSRVFLTWLRCAVTFFLLLYWIYTQQKLLQMPNCAAFGCKHHSAKYRELSLKPEVVQSSSMYLSRRLRQYANTRLRELSNRNARRLVSNE